VGVGPGVGALVGNDVGACVVGWGVGGRDGCGVVGSAGAKDGCGVVGGGVASSVQLLVAQRDPGPKNVASTRHDVCNTSWHAPDGIQHAPLAALVYTNVSATSAAQQNVPQKNSATRRE